MLCLKGTCCPCFVMGRTMHRVEHPNEPYDSCNGDCMAVCAIHTIGGGCGWHMLGWA